MYANKDIGEAFNEQVTVASVVANHLGLKANFFSNNKDSSVLKETFELFKIEGVVHLKLPAGLREYLTEYNASVVGIEEDEEEFDYVIRLNSKNKIGFWK